VLHPMVYKPSPWNRPQSSECLAHIAIGIYGMENAKGDALLEEIVSHSLNPAFAYYHDWKRERPRALGQLADPALWPRRGPMIAFVKCSGRQYGGLCFGRLLSDVAA